MIESNEELFDFENTLFSNRKDKKHKTRTQRKERIQFDTSSTVLGKVIESQGKFWLVKTSNANYLCEMAGSVSSPDNDGSLVVVGDLVEVVPNETTENEGKIVLIQERKTKLSRTAVGKNTRKEQVIVANVDQLIIMVAADDPPYRTRFIDRMLISASKGGLEPVLFINKSEFLPLDIIQEDLQDYYSLLKKNILVFSLEKRINCDSIKHFFTSKTSVVAGPSGVGKSTLVNFLLGNNNLKVGSTSKKWKKGKHTTSNVTLQPLPFEGFIVDTPGIRELSIWSIDKDELMYYFDEFERYRKKCKFSTCTHLHEPDCAVITAVEKGKISSRRYESYAILFEEITQKS